jgi:Kef-type K+ transport system membrane component KefB
MGKKGQAVSFNRQHMIRKCERLDSHSLLRDVALCILGATLLAVPAHIFRLPLVLAYLIAGVIIGPSLGFGLITETANIATMSSIGLVLLMFILGLEIDIRKLLRAGKAVLVNGVTQFVGCACLAALFFSLFGFSNAKGNYTLTYLAVACSLSSTLVVVKMLSDRMELDLLTSRLTLGILVIQDLWAITFLAIQPKLHALSLMTVFLSLSKAALLITSAWLIAKFLLPKLFHRVGKQPELLIVTAMGWCFGICGLAGWLNLSVEMGALIAGVCIASFPYHSEIAAKISSLRDFFITLFFVALGMQIPMPNIQVLGLTGLIVIFVTISRVLTVFPVLHLMRYGNRASLIPALNLSQLSEFSLVLAALGVSYKHISSDILAAFILAMVITFLISSVLIPGSYSIHRKVGPLLEKIGLKDRFMSVDLEEQKPQDMQQKIVLLGFYREASSFLQEVVRRHSQTMTERLLVIDYNPETLAKLKAKGVSCKYGDVAHSETLRHLHLDQAMIVISTIPDHLLKGTSNLKLLATLKHLAPQARIVVTAETLDAAREMYRQGADYVFIPRIVAAHYLVDVIDRVQGNRMDAIKQGAQRFLSEWEEILP